ncbi:hypothetical protein CBF60_00335 [Lactobacillus taiwanensis]|uniref:hypothetical protein n=1 Tax=Lactobacillus taiwanensis TaxID=508451 RepID=UPI000B98D88C|nr:hypothetical protein [Lactobacillus taiwanensis]MCR1904295.1 hypothetical protein [Lactobacillus taiwanensis]MRM99576.1 hypothetical protein [Lactobacillus taiwanensis]OYS00584.1 hypothetical protein CBF64_01455 [Lactobacillus taiwanensis]OYS04048.1 hypothetical protein CBF68_04410 [Lactobacillus taiwanensis]OYS21394.1 hypothetical protein CBF76_02335 [Lactobacillus taiwanensis]
MSQNKCIIDNEKSKNAIKLADGNSICEDHAKLTPWQKEELIEKDANQVTAYIDKLTDTYLFEHELQGIHSSYKSLLNKAAQSDLMKNTSAEDTIKLQNWILIKQNTEIINLLKELKSQN